MKHVPLVIRWRLTGPSQAGIALATALLFLLIVSIVTVAVYQNVIAQGRMAGGFREKGRAFEAAQSALQYGERWVKENSSQIANNASVPACSSELYNASAGAAPSSQSAWSVLAGGNYAPSVGMTIADSGNASFARETQYCIEQNTNDIEIYKITATAYGGNMSTAAVVQSTYIIPASVAPFGPNP